MARPSLMWTRRGFLRMSGGGAAQDARYWTTVRNAFVLDHTRRLPAVSDGPRQHSIRRPCFTLQVQTVKF
jgi:hypothetical protein